MSRALTADETNRYPWASRINDYVPVGRLRHVALAASGIGLLVLLCGAGILFLRTIDVRSGIGITSTPFGQLTLLVSGIFVGIGLVVGAYTAVTAAIHNATTPLVWSLAAMTPGVIALLLVAART